MQKKIPYRTYLREDQLPKYWYNLRTVMKEDVPPMLNPGTGKPMTFEELSAVFSEECVKQELDSATEYVEIPEEVRHIYTEYRPSPLVRAYNVEKALNTPAKIYYKFEGNNTSGSHKLNSAIPQAYYAKKQGLKGLTTETGAGQWGTAVSEACSYFGLDLDVFMVKVSYEQKPFRKTLMRVFGGKVVASPSDTTEAGKKILEINPATGGSLGCAISEAVEAAVTRRATGMCWGRYLTTCCYTSRLSALNAKPPLLYDEYPDIVIGCAGGGSNLGGLIAPLCGIRLPERQIRKLSP